MMESFKVVSLNANGLNDPRKRRIVFDHLRQTKADLCLIQETHCTLGTEKIWKQEWGGSTNLIIGGHYNCCLNPALDRNREGATPSQSHPMGNKISRWMEDWNLCDILRIRNPNTRRYTFRRGDYASRLDYLFISEHLSENGAPEAPRPIAHSDHAMIAVSWKSNHNTRGPGLWRLDTSLLQEEDFVLQMLNFLDNWESPPELSNPNSIWEWLKYEIKRVASAYTAKSHSLEKQHILDRNKELSELYQEWEEGGVDVSTEIESVRRELREVEEAKARKIIFRARSNWTLFGERPTKYFLNLEKCRSKEKKLNLILSEEGESLTRPEDILQEGRNFYANLYQDRETSLQQISEVEDELAQMTIPQLSDTDKESLEAPFREEELHKALGLLNTNKSPGTDGLPPEFYSKFWHLIAPHYIRSLQYSIEIGRLSDSQRRGVITLIPKRDVDGRYIANWRPITLLNADYKIYTKAIALRLQRVMGSLIHPNQTGFMPGRIIGDSIRAVEDSIDRIKEEHEEGMIVALDFVKAFDSIRWSLIFKTLERFNFGECFVKFIKVLFVDIESCLLNDGRTSQTFHQGIRQGCCASPTCSFWSRKYWLSLSETTLVSGESASREQK